MKKKIMRIVKWIVDKISFLMAYVVEYSFIGFKVTIFCPVCHSRLVYGDIRQYETLSDHVVAPNDDPPMRPSFICVDGDCPLNFVKTHTFYGMDGSRYGWSELDEPYRDKRYWAAIGSWEWNYHRRKR